MSFQLNIKKHFTASVLPALIFLAPLLVVTVALNWHTASIERTMAYTIAFVNGLSIGSLAFYMVVMLGFAFSHTENGKRIILPINISAATIFVLWVSIYFYLSPSEPWEFEPLVKMLDTQIMMSLSIAVMPFLYFYLTGPKPSQEKV